MASNLVWGYVQRRRNGVVRYGRALRLRSTGQVFEPVDRGSGYMKPAEEKVGATFVSRLELAARAQQDEPDEPAPQP